jgi:hypothetical protein
MEYYSAIKKNEILSFFKGKLMKLENIMISEVSQVQKVEGHIFSHMWKIDLNTNASIIINTDAPNRGNC